MHHRSILSAILVSLCVSIAAAAEPATPDYVRDVAPLLKKYCAGCHNEDDREGELALDSFAQLQRGGERGPVALAGDSKASRLLLMLTGEAEPRMPPEDSETPSADEIDVLRRWVDGGAKGPAGEEPPRQLITPQLKPFPGVGAVTAADWSPDGKWIAVARFGKVQLMDSETGKVVRPIGKHPGKVNSVRFSSLGDRLVTASGVTGLQGVATIWEVASGKQLHQFKGHRDAIYSAALSPSGDVLATSSYDGKIRLWTVASGENHLTLGGHNGAVYDLAFSPDGRHLASASADETVKIWEVKTGRRMDTLGQPLDEQFVVRFSPDGRFIAAGGADNRIRVWKFVSREKQQINPLLFARFAHDGAVLALAYTPDGKRLLSLSDDRSAKLWETDRYTTLMTLEEQPDVAVALAVAPDSKSFLVGRMDGAVQVYATPQVAVANRGANNLKTVIVATDEMSQIDEREPNDAAEQAQAVSIPATIKGHVRSTAAAQSDADLFRFQAKTGEQWVLEVNAARNKSKLDSKVEVLSAAGEPIARVKLQAVRDSYFTFRGKDSNTIDDFRVHNWEEMELNEYLYSDGEVVKLWLWPRGPDSGFKVYPGEGKRYGYFGTTPTSHALQAPCFIVEPHSPSAKLIPNGLPTFTLFFENDDESQRRLGSDSKLTFTAPADGQYLARVTDVRGFAGDDFHYSLTIRPRRPDFKVTLGGANPTVNKAGGREFSVRAERIDNFDGPIRVDIENAPPGFHVTSPITIEAEQNVAYGVISADADAPAPTAENAKATSVAATALINDAEVTHGVNNLGEIKLAEAAKVVVRLRRIDDAPDARYSADNPLELVVAPGQTIQAKVVVERRDFKARISFGNADAGRNLPHGVIVDNIGLNGLLVVEGKSERSFFITAAKWAPDTTRPFHILARVEGNQATLPVVLRVRRPEQTAAAGED